MGIRCLCLLSAYVLIQVKTVPPDACFANFRWDDCGMPPVPVMYYWKPGSRCEVGLWRGCLPNINMFPDEYECVTTCIFTARALAEDYHSMNENEIEGRTEFYVTEVTENVNATDATGNVTTAGNIRNMTSAVTVSSGNKTNSVHANATVAAGNATSKGVRGGQR